MMNSITARWCVGTAALLGAASVALVLAKPSATTAASTAALPHVAPVVAAAAMYEPPVYIGADAKHVAKGYVGYSVTSYSATHHSIVAIRSGGLRDRTADLQTAASWASIAVSTESNRATFRVAMVNDSLAQLEVNQVLAAEAAPDRGGVWESVCIDVTPISESIHALEVLMDFATDRNLNAHVEVLGPFETKAVPCCDGGEGGAASSALCFRPAWWDPEVKFVGCAGCGICVIPSTGGGNNCNPADGTWYPTDGIILPGYGPGQWYKIPDNCTVTVTCNNCVPSISCCCNLFFVIVDACRIQCGATCSFQDCCANPNDRCAQHSGAGCNNCP